MKNNCGEILFVKSLLIFEVIRNKDYLLEIWCCFLEFGVRVKIKDDFDRFFFYIFVSLFCKLLFICKILCEGIEFFYKYGCVINCRDVDGNILLYLWVRLLVKNKNNEEVGNRIIDCGGVVNLRNDSGEILLYFV